MVNWRASLVRHMHNEIVIHRSAFLEEVVW